MDIFKECAGAKTIAVSGHVRPDGDCIGSCTALALYLRKRMPDVQVDVYLDPIADYFDCIKGSELIMHEPKTGIKYDVFICVDCEPGRMSFGHELFESAGKTINIDHHVTNLPGGGDVNYVYPESASAAELVYQVIDHDHMDADIALPIYIGIIHDTGVLQYSNVSPDTLRTVAELIGYGIDFPNVIQKTFYEKTYIQSQILGRALLESMLFMDGRCAVSVVDKKTMEFYGADSRDLEGIVNQLRNIRGVDCAIFMYEIGVLEYKVSLRTSEAVDASVVASVYGGGGHARAAGVTMQGTYHDVINNLSKEIAKQLKNSAG
ncbi:MAG: DHH family phosphoesterase [Lachnospiraceae bacterium]|nr:DHH family phosphoesterase [Lachnospiraceae bacterium]